MVEIDVSELTPRTTRGFKPDNVVPVEALAGQAVDQVYIGSCTNGRIEDLRVAAAVLKGNTISENVRAIVSPATPHIFQQALDEGLVDIFMEAGFCVTNPTCGACLGMSNGVLAEEVDRASLDGLFARFAGLDTTVETDLERGLFTFASGDRQEVVPFSISGFDRELIHAGGSVEYADSRY